MKKVFFVLLALFLPLSFCSAMATEPPAAVDNELIFSILPPAPPVDSECTDLYSISNSRCSSDIRLYDYCAPTMQEGVGAVEQRSENCRAYGNTWVCQDSDCIDTGIVQPDKPGTTTSVLGGVAIVAVACFALYFVAKKVVKK